MNIRLQESLKNNSVEFICGEEFLSEDEKILFKNRIQKIILERDEEHIKYLKDPDKGEVYKDLRGPTRMISYYRENKNE